MAEKSHPDIAKNLNQITERIRAACERSNRNLLEVKLVAVSKTVPASVALEAVKAGITNLGENRASEIIEKYKVIGSLAIWHFVGHLQRNKVKRIINFVDLIHSLDSLALAEEIDRRAKEINKVQKVLVEVNVSGETSKYGLRPDAVFAFIRQVKNFDNLKVKGLMTMTPLGCSETEARTIFRNLSEINKRLAASGLKTEWLSMGMTDDFEIAVEEGASIVRIGRAIFKGT